MVNKKRALQKTDIIQQLLKPVSFNADDSPVQIHSKPYVALGCDLRNLDKLDHVLETEILPSECAVLFLAEVSLTYMDVKSANAVINWASKLSDGSQNHPGRLPLS